MILRFGRTRSVQVQVSRLKRARWGWSVPRPRSESLPNTPPAAPEPTSWWTFFTARDVEVSIEHSSPPVNFDLEPRDPWERDADWWKQK